MIVRLPASTSNLGPGFDCFGLALKLYLTVRANSLPTGSEQCRVTTTGAKQNEALPRNATNLIYRAMAFAARREGAELRPVELVVHNEIPLASGLGSSAAALHGGFSASCICNDGSVASLRFEWPSQIRVVVVSPHSQLPTHVARAALPRTISRLDAVHNLQRTALFTSALAQQRYDLLWETMRDRLHQPQRESLVPGLAEALALPRMQGLLGIALSGAGPSIVALVDDNDEEIGERIASCFRGHRIESTIRILEVDNDGCQILAADERG